MNTRQSITIGFQMGLLLLLARARIAACSKGYTNCHEYAGIQGNQHYRADPNPSSAATK